MKKKKIRVRVSKKDITEQKKLHKRVTKIVKLKCSLQLHPTCKEQAGVWYIDTTKPEIYTKEVRQRWTCLLCRTLKKKR